MPEEINTDNSGQDNENSIEKIKMDAESKPEQKINAHIDNVEKINVFTSVVSYLPQIGVGVIVLLIISFLGWSVIKDTRTFDEVFARGIITILVAVATIGIALLLTFWVVISSDKDYKERFALGKEILTLLIGVLGTIIGFYFGSATTQQVDGKNSEMLEVPMATVINSQLNGKESFVLSTIVKGGDPPYQYRIYFEPREIADSISGTSETGLIQENFAKPSKIPENGLYNISIVDKSKNSKTLGWQLQVEEPKTENINTNVNSANVNQNANITATAAN